MNLQYKTRKMSNPQGKPKVFFSCFPDDFETAFPIISDDILNCANCSVWYDADITDREYTEEEAEEIEDILKDMQIVVFAVTSRFLHEEHSAKTLELPFALANHIPILPIMLENGLEYEFDNICAEIQIVNRYVSDPTATPYEEVLQTFLDSVLVGDELAEKVRTAFDAYVFLSYRKKDRKYARRLMRLIHENELFRDIAIWYDEYLVPGEGFNEAIKAAFEKSFLFAMTVTPNLEEKNNYVMCVEYPMARDRIKDEKDFDIVSVEMYEEEGDKTAGTEWRLKPQNLKDHKEFRYQEIPDLQNEHRETELNRSLLDKLLRIAKTENDANPQHKFFIGLAYLNGIDVEVNAKRAFMLLKESAEDPESPCMEATEKLADMYLHGEGVGRDLSEAISWQRKLASQYKSAYDKDHDPDAHKGFGTEYFKALRKLSDMYRSSGNIKEGISIAAQALEFSSKLEQEVGSREQERDRAVMLSRMGKLYYETGDYQNAEEMFTEAGMIYEKQAAEIGTARARRDLSISYERLGDIFRKKKDTSSAEEYYLKAKNIRTQLDDTFQTVRTRTDLSSVLTKLGNLRKADKDYPAAKVYYDEALALDSVLAGEVRSDQSLDNYGVSLTKVGDIHRAEGRFAEAEDCYLQACDIFRTNSEKTGSIHFRDHLAGGYEKLAKIRKHTGEREEAAALFRESVDLRREIYHACKTVESADSYAVTCYNAATFFDDRDLMMTAYQIWSELSFSHPEYEKYKNKAKAKCITE